MNDEYECPVCHHDHEQRAVEGDEGRAFTPGHSDHCDCKVFVIRQPLDDSGRRRYMVEASELGLGVGRWPSILSYEGVTFDIVRTTTYESRIYRQSEGLEIEVFND